MNRGAFYMVLAAAAVWWTPTIMLRLAAVGFLHFGIRWRLRRVERLMLAGRIDEAAAGLERVRSRLAKSRRERRP